MQPLILNRIRNISNATLLSRRHLHCTSTRNWKIQEYSTQLRHIQRCHLSANTQTHKPHNDDDTNEHDETEFKANQSESESESQSEAADQNDRNDYHETIDPQHDANEEHVFDPSFDNLIHGVWTREDFQKRQGRVESEVGTLGRIFLYQYNCCPFCGKVKAVLDYYSIPYSLIEVSPISKSQLPNHHKFLHDRNVPILLAAKAQPGPNKYHFDQKVTYNSNVIISTLLEYLVLTGIMPQSEYDRSRSSIVDAWQEWMDNNLIPHIYCAIDYDSHNVTSIDKLFHDGKNAKQEENSTDLMFRYLAEFKKFESLTVTTYPMRTMCSQLFHNQAKQLRQKYGIPTGFDIEYLKQVMDEWHQVTKISFHGGSKPDLADLMCFGIFRTFHNIPIVQEMLKETNLTEWYETCEELVGQHSCVTHG